VTNIPNPQVNTAGVLQHTYQAEVQILNFDMGLAPVYGQLQKVAGLDGSWLYDTKSQMVYSTRSTVKGKTYHFDFVATSYDPAALRRSTPVAPNDPLRQYTQVPQVPFVTSLVSGLIKGKTTVYDQVLALYDYFSTLNGFSYSLSTAYGTSDSDIVNFLKNQKGYCEQYAAALAWLVRSAGIPARVAFGFTRGSNHSGDTYTLTNNNLHAWTEVYFAGFGWVPFDATPSTGITGSVSPEWAPDQNNNNAVTPTVPITGSSSGTTGGASASAGAGPHDVDNSGDLNFGTLKTPAPTWPWWLLGGGVTVLLLLCAPAVGRAILRRRRRIGRTAMARATAVPIEGDLAPDAPGQMRVVVGPAADLARREAHATWDELLDTLIDYRIPVPEAETPRVTARRVANSMHLPGPAAEALALLGRTEEQARYARQPFTEPGLGRALRTVRRSVRGTVSRRTRLRAAIFPPSVLGRWRTGSALAISAIVARAGRVRDGVLDAVMPRRLRPARTR
jgi:transglutaminase-like putative cysteine protease